nr:unnamed protein product [Callosobruchus analis]
MFYPLSENILLGKPLRATKRFSIAKNPSVVKEVTSSKCIALVLIHTNRAI